MANFVDQYNRQYNPYVAEQPVEAMATTGLHREEAFNAGITKVQNYFDTIAGLDIAKDATKQYVAQKLQQVKESMTKNLSGDFSDARVTDQIGGAASQIYKDPIVQNGVIATSQAKSYMTRMAEDEKAGKLSPANADYFNTNYNQWLTDGQVDTKLNATYTTDWGIDKHIVDAIKDAHASGAIDDQTWQDIPKDRNGNPNETYLLEMSRKGLAPSRIKNIISTVLAQPEAQQQLGISSWYQYKGVTPLELYNSQLDSKKYIDEQYDNRLKYFQTQYNLGNAAQKVEIQNHIDELNSEYEANYKDLKETGDLLSNANQNSPEEYQASIDKFKKLQYTNNLVNRYTNAYGWGPISQKEVDRPAFKAAMEQSRLLLEQNKFIHTQAQDQIDNYFKGEHLKIDQKTLDLKTKGKIDENGNPIPDTGLGVSTTSKTGIDAKDLEGLGSASYIQNVQNPVHEEESQLIADIIYQSQQGSTNTPLYIKDENGNIKPNLGPGGFNSVKEWTQALQPTLTQVYATNNSATPNKDIRDKITQLNKVSSIRDAIDTKVNDLNKNLNQSLSILNSKPILEGNKVFNLKGDLVDIDKPALVDLALFLSNNTGSIGPSKNALGEQAYKRLVSRFGDSGAGSLINHFANATETNLRGGPEENSIKSFNILKNEVKSNSKISQAFTSYENQFRNLQSGLQAVKGTLNMNKPENRTAALNFVTKAISDVPENAMNSEDKQIIGDLISGKNKDNTIVTVGKNASDNKTYIEVSGFDSKGISITKKILTEPSYIINNIKGVDFSKSLYDSEVRPLANLNNGSTLPEKVPAYSDKAGFKALPLPQGNYIGKYKVGYHTSTEGGLQLPILYIQDTQTGEFIRKGVRIYPSLFLSSKDTDLTKQLAEKANGKYTEQGLMDMLQSLNKDNIELFLKNTESLKTK